MAYGGFRDIASGPAPDAFAVTGNDTTDLSVPIRRLFITGAGDVKFDTISGSTRTITVPAGFYHDCVITRVYATGTTATGLIGYA